MNANETNRANAPDEIIELGVASVETKGDIGDVETLGIDLPPGI